MNKENVAAVIPVSLTPRNVFGLRNEVVGCIHISFNQEVIYPVEAVIVFHDFNTNKPNKQRFLRLPEDTVPSVMAINPTRRLLAVVEIHKTAETKTTVISVYDTSTLLKRRTFKLPEDAEDLKITQMAFVQDSRALLVLTQHPNEMLYMMFFDKTGTILERMVGQPNTKATVTCVAGNVQDVGLVAVGGKGISKLVSKSETGLSVSSTFKANLPVRSMAWLSMESLMLGLTKNRLILIDNGEIKSHFKASEVELIDIAKDMEPEDLTADQEANVTAMSNEPVSLMAALSKILVYVISDEVIVFEKVSKFKYQRLAIIKLHKGIYNENMYRITNMSVSPQQDKVIVVAMHGQIYVCSWKGLVVSDTTTNLQFEPLGALIHIDEIVDMSVCSWRSIIMTASKDQTIRIWNYEKEQTELIKRYQVDITAIELNETGQFAAIGFSDQLRIMQILMDDLNIIKTYNFPRCAQAKYSFLGHYMAAAYDNKVSITSVYNLSIIRTLKGHNGNVLTVAWSRDDKYLISGGAEGAIYQWDVETGDRVQEIVQKGTEYRGLVCTGDPLSYFAITASGLLRELANSEMLRELSTPARTPFLSITLARSDQMLFLSTEAGHVYNVQLPFLEAGGGTFTNNRFFDSAVTKIKFSYDDTLLITGSKRGTLAIWILRNIEGKVAPMDQDLLRGQEVLISRQVLREKIEQIANLEVRLQQQAAEFEYQLSQNEIFDSQQLAHLHKGYCQALEVLKNRNNELEQEHIEELNDITFKINDLRTEHKNLIKNLSEQFAESMLMEYQKYTSFSQSSNEIKESYEEKLRQSAGFLQDSVEALEIDFKKQLEQRQVLIRELMQEIQDEKYEFNEYCRQVEVENKSNMMDAVIKYENICKEEQDEEVLWRGHACVLKKKSETMSKEAERLMEEVELLNEEHTKSQKLIGRFLREIEDLRKDVTDREFAMSAKEKRIQEIMHKNQELEKYKQVLSHRITQLKMQIEPRECQINEKRKQITEMEEQLKMLNKTNIELEVQLKSLNEKYVKSAEELEDQRHSAVEVRALIHNICSGIYYVAGKINDPKALKDGIKELLKKYANDESIKKHIILETQVQKEFNRQRAYLEKSITECKKKLQDRGQLERSKNLLKENISILNDIEGLRKENVALKKELGNLESSLKISRRKDAAVQRKLIRTLAEIQSKRNETEGQIENLQERLESLQSENEELNKKLLEINEVDGVQ